MVMSRTDILHTSGLVWQPGDSQTSDSSFTLMMNGAMKHLAALASTWHKEAKETISIGIRSHNLEPSWVNPRSPVATPIPLKTT